MRGATQARRSSRIELKAAAAPVPRRRASTRSAGLILTLAVLHGLCLLWLHLLWLWNACYGYTCYGYTYYELRAGAHCMGGRRRSSNTIVIPIMAFFLNACTYFDSSPSRRKSSVRSQVLYLYLLWLYLLWYCYGCESTYDVQCKLTTASPPHHHRTSPERYKST